MASMTAIPTPVEAAKAESVRRNALYRAHVESCPRAYLGQPCVNCYAYDRDAEAADWALARERAAARASA